MKTENKKLYQVQIQINLRKKFQIKNQNGLNLKIDIDKKLGDIMDFKESKTYKNLEKAFEGEAKAHLKYQFYKSKIARNN